MKKRLILAIVALLTLCGTVFAQSLDEQFEKADAELNRVYKELRSQLNDEQKAELKKGQLAWIKEKDSLAKLAGSESKSIKVLVDLTKQRAQILAEQLHSRGNSIATNRIQRELVPTFQEWPDINQISGFCISGNFAVVYQAGGNIFIFDNKSKMLLRKVNIPGFEREYPVFMTMEPETGEIILRLMWPPYQDIWLKISAITGDYLVSDSPENWVKNGLLRISKTPKKVLWNQDKTMPIALWDIDKKTIPTNMFFSDLLQNEEKPLDPKNLKSGPIFLHMALNPLDDSRERVQKIASNYWIFAEKKKQSPSWVRYLDATKPDLISVAFSSMDPKRVISEIWSLHDFRRTQTNDVNFDIVEVPLLEIKDKSPSSLAKNRISKNWRGEFISNVGSFDMLPESTIYEESELPSEEELHSFPVVAFPASSKQFVAGIGIEPPHGLSAFNNCYMLKASGLILWDSAEFISYDGMAFSPKILWKTSDQKAIAIRIPSNESNSQNLPILPRTHDRATFRPAIGHGQGKNDFLLKSDRDENGLPVIWHLNSKNIATIKKFPGIVSGGSPVLDSSGGRFYTISADSKSIDSYDYRSGRRVFSLFPAKETSFTIVTPEGFYSGQEISSNFVGFAIGKHAYPFEQFDLRLNRPDIVLERLGAPDEAIAIAKQLREKRLKRMGVTEDMLQPDFHIPEIEILGDLPSSTAENELTLTIKASDSKYPLDRLRLYVNNVPVNGKEGELLRDAKSQTLERTIPLKLAAGRNKIQVSVLNSAGAESLYANAEITCTAPRTKPTLYAVAMGVSEYSNPEWNLKYAAKDANDIIARIRSKSGSSYGEVKELLLTDREVTKENLAKIREFLSKATVDDTVLMFVAGHGLLDSKYDYYFGTSDIDFENPSGKGIAFEEFDDLLAELPCLKKSLLIDTCHAGELDEDEKKALAAAQSAPTGQQVAMHPVGARGMSVKPIEGARGKSEWYDRLQGLFVDLRRGSGSTILSSSAGAEYALESSEQKNGLFTYAVLEALNGKEGSDANKDGSVSMSELAEYVKSRVATLTNNKQSPNVRRVNLEADFALVNK